jgi:preprotein translocase subunit SecG
MYIVLSVLLLIVCILLILIVLVQNSKGGGLASNFSSSNQYMGVRKTADFLEKSTWTLAIILLLLSLGSVMTINRGENEGNQSQIEQLLQESPEKVQKADGFDPSQTPQQAPVQPGQ